MAAMATEMDLDGFDIFESHASHLTNAQVKRSKG